MKLLELIRRESSVSLVKIIFIGLLAGLTQALVLSLINAAGSEKAAQEGKTFGLLLMFTATLVGHILAQKYILVTSTELVEGVLSSIRLRVVGKISASELQSFEKIGRARIYSNVTKETVTISQATPPIVVAAQSGVMIFFALIYLAWLSLPVFFVTVILSAVGISFHLIRRRERYEYMQKAHERENEFFELLTHLLDGFKEVKMSTARSEDLVEHLRAVSASLEELKVRYGHQFAIHYIFSQTAFYVLIASIVFLLPQMAQTTHEVLAKSTATILFIIGPLSNFIGSIPSFASANVAAENIYELEEELDRGHETPASLPTAASPLRGMDAFNEIRFEKVLFNYVDNNGQPTFSLTPIDLTISAGETVFIVGGNGSGKSTFLKLLTGLYFPTSGKIRVDGVDLRKPNYPEYRDLFAAIFSDYHLFDRLYGVNSLYGSRGVGYQHVQGLLKEMGLDSKTQWLDDHFTNLDLSTGQRKRLALLSSLLENKPIYVFDEWAAEQDPDFRKYFYEVVLQNLKNQGKTIIVATHDEKYFHVADRVMKMEYGQFVSRKDEDSHD
jgi:putative ATP-binding cassette transporter